MKELIEYMRETYNADLITFKEFFMSRLNACYIVRHHVSENLIIIYRDIGFLTIKDGKVITRGNI